MHRLLIHFLSFLAVFSSSCQSTVGPSEMIPSKISRPIESQRHTFVVDTLAKDLKIPWAISWLPDGKALISERNTGQVRLLDPTNGGLKTLIHTLKVYGKADGGMLDIAVHPDFSRNHWIYLAYSVSRPDSSSTTVVDRATLTEDSLRDRKRIFTALPYYKSDNHFGCRLLLKDGYLFIAIGDRFRRDSAQSLKTHNGKILRLYESGGVPGDNPFLSLPGAKPEIWSYGHRNPQGMTMHPVSKEVWINEHGPKGGDEINIVRPGRNYGWPLITYGEEYAGGPVGKGLQALPGMEQPIYYYKPSIAPSDMLFYTGEAFPNWEGDLFLGAMALRHLNRLQLDGHEIVGEERLLDGQNRIRSTSQGPDDYIYLGVDSGWILRLRPVQNQ